MKISSINIIQRISRCISILFFTISCVITLILIYLLFGGSLVGNIEIGTSINSISKLKEYGNFNEVPFLFKLFMGLFMGLILFLINTILRYWNNFMSLVTKGRCFEIDTIKNLKGISFILFGIWMVLFIVEFISETTLRTSVLFQQNFNDNIIKESPDLGFNLGFGVPPLTCLIISTILWVVSHILIEGIKLKKENELTI